MILVNRNWVSGTENYRFGFNGKEKTNEVYNDNCFQDYGLRSYDVRLGRFISSDPLTKNYPYWTPYQFAGNIPIKFIDLDGGEPKSDGEKDGDYQSATLNGTDSYYGWTWNSANKQWNRGALLEFTAGDVTIDSDHDLDKKQHAPEDRSKAVQSYIDDGIYGYANAYTDFTYTFTEGTILKKTRADDNLLQHFMYGDGSTAEFGPNSDMSSIIGDVKAFKDFADAYEAAALAWYKAKGNLDEFDGQMAIEQNRPDYIGDPITSLFANTVMGGYKQIDTKITKISSSEINVTYIIYDHFGAGVKDANSYVPGLAAMYYLQHYEGVMGIQFTPFIWNVTINR